MPDTREILMDTAERSIRLGGYNAVSFRELADALGIKSASVHYYFRKKEDLGVALVDRYSQRFFAVLEKRADGARTAEALLDAYCQTYRTALTSSDAICLCGMLGAETSGLPDAVSSAVRTFFRANLEWLVDAMPKGLDPAAKTARASHVLAALQGAMMLSHNMDDISVFDAAAEVVKAGL
ncbi:TetR/AcrR family transcriptional regulator [uncultured Roseobacter sp.]|uniref:TetR/AcrR family transcriptional regulator n=1 Tax=uncultured Roseobacter sp. TaxID=114847 RepID=UPI002610B742|nr:TetR/AcrR family transcriptional regulator [uncultured Roseobacter sp.]